MAPVSAPVFKRTEVASFVARLSTWQPLTGKGLAAFAQASTGRLLLFQVGFVWLTALLLAWGLAVAWVPVVEKSLLALPDAGAEVRQGRLLWPAETQLLASSPHLALAVVPEAEVQLGQNGDVQVELHPVEFRFRGLLGQLRMTYPPTLVLPLDRTGATAAWGAWRLPLLILVGLGVGIGLLMLGWFLAALYAPVLALAAWLMRRPLPLKGAWKLGLAALMPASLLIDLGLMVYARQWIGLPLLTALFGLHFPASWMAAFWGLLRLPRQTVETADSNPFGAEALRPRPNPAAKPRNPFGS